MNFSCRKRSAPGPALQTLLPGRLVLGGGRSLFPLAAALRAADAEPVLLRRGGPQGGLHVLWLRRRHRRRLGRRGFTASAAAAELQHVDFSRTLHRLQRAAHGDCPLPALPAPLHRRPHDAAAPGHGGPGLAAAGERPLQRLQPAGPGPGPGARPRRGLPQGAGAPGRVREESALSAPERGQRVPVLAELLALQGVVAAVPFRDGGCGELDRRVTPEATATLLLRDSSGSVDTCG